MLNKIVDFIKSQKKYMIILSIVIVLFLILQLVIPVIQNKVANKTPIVKITAECDKIYDVDSKIKLKDFSITAEHQDGAKSSLTSDDVRLSTTKITPVGDCTTVIVSLKSNPDIQCNVTIHSEREKIVGFQCGYPHVKDVVAVLYNNGELCFEGSGDVLVFDEGACPWLDYEEMEAYPIRSVSFQDSVQPTDMNYWFEKIDTLTYVAPIPSSVKTMVQTFAECENLTRMANISNCSALLNISGCYQDCTALYLVSPIPPSVTTAISAFSNCAELKCTPELTNATNLTNMELMFADCKKLVTVSMPPSVMNLEGTFQNCINLKTMPSIPVTTQNMNATFQGDVSLTTLSNIPKNVSDVSNCFDCCEMITGDLIVASNAQQYTGMFSNASLATTINLTGTSKYLQQYANTGTYGNVYVNGRLPDPNVRFIDTIIS